LKKTHFFFCRGIGSKNQLLKTRYIKSLLFGNLANKNKALFDIMKNKYFDGNHKKNFKKIPRKIILIY
jgi:hypothetical protein